MSRFLDQIESHQEAMRRSDEEYDMEMNYNTFRINGLTKPYTVRLPVTTLAQLDYLLKFGPWNTKQEMLYSMINGAILDFIESSGVGVPVRQEFIQIAKKALEETPLKDEREEQLALIQQELAENSNITVLA